MSLSIGLVGLPNAGKSTLFNALLKKQQAEARNFPFTTIDPNIGIVNIPDTRLDQLASIVTPEKIIPATTTFVDIAGIVGGAHKGEGLGNKFLANIREVDAIIVVVRDFEDPNVIHVAGKVSPINDFTTIQTELALKDLETVQKRLSSLEKEIKAESKDALLEKSTLDKIFSKLEQGRPVSSLLINENEAGSIKHLNLLTSKPFIIALNIAEKDLGRAGERVEQFQKQLNSPTPPQAMQAGRQSPMEIVPISAKVEADLSILSEEDQKVYLEDLGIEEPGLNKLIKSAFKLLSLITFFTAGPKEVRAWITPAGSTAPQAAGKIHTDFERGFIKAEVISFNDFIDCKGEQGARSVGKLRLEGRDYIVADGDVVHFKFNT